MQPAAILFVSSYSGLGGGERAILNLAEQLDPAQYRPHLLVPRADTLADAWRAAGWPVHVMPWRGATVYFVPALWGQLPISHAITRLIRAEGIRAVHSDYHTLPMAAAAAQRASVPIIWTCMGWWFHPQPWQRAFFRRLPVIFAHSQAIKDGFLGTPPFMPPGTIDILYPGVDTARFHPGVDGARVRFQAGFSPQAPVVALVARFQSVKGHEVFLAMAQQVALQVPQARFIIAGENTQSSADNAYRDGIVQAVQQDRLLRDRLVFLGYREDVERVYGAADVVVCSSFFESYGLANVEAMACGKPVVSTNQGGPAETVLQGVTGYLVEPGDAAGLAAHVIGLLRDPALRARMGMAGRERACALYDVRQSAALFNAGLARVLT